MHRLCASLGKNVKCFAVRNSSSQASLEHYWIPFTNNRDFKKNPKLIDSAKGVKMYADGRELIDASSGLWCVNAGHCHPKIVEAIQKQAKKMDYAPAFNASHRGGFELAERLIELLPNRGFGNVFFTMCGSSAVDTSLKIALAYHRSKGEGQRVRFIGRDKGYHGVGFGGISVGGLVNNRKQYAVQLPYVDHLPHYHSLKDMAFSRGLPTWGGHCADELERIVQVHDPSTIAGVIIEPVVGSAGVFVPPVGYLQKIRDICTKYNLLLIFDEVITGFGRIGASFATEKFNITPDMITCAKGLTNATVPAGAVICQSKIYESIRDQADRENSFGPELFHGYTYSAHPLATAAGIATLDVYKEEGLFERTNELAPYFENALHSLKGLPHVVDIRNYGLMGAVELAPHPSSNPAKRAAHIFELCWQKGVFYRQTGTVIAMSPPLIIKKEELDKMLGVLREAIIESGKTL